MTPQDRSWRGQRFYHTPRRVKNKGLIKKRKFNVHSHSFQDTELKLHRYIETIKDSTGQVMGVVKVPVVEGLVILPYPQRDRE
jgi:hypothetical protein